MYADPARIDALLAEVDRDGYLLEAAGEVPEQRYLSGLWTSDPFATLYVDGAVHCLVKPLEFNRARREATAATVSNVAEYGFFDRLEGGDRTDAWAATVADFCRDHDATDLVVPERFPLAVAEALTERGLSALVDPDGVLDELRAVKAEPELEAIATAQSAAEAAMATAEDRIAEADVADGTLVHDGEALTSEAVKTAIERTLLDHRCALDETIVACGPAAGDPHDRGSGALRAGETIVIDIFPRHKDTGYHGDLTRTFVKGEATDRQRAWHADTLDAMAAAKGAIRPGVDGAAVHDAVCDTYEASGHPTLRSDPTTETGFIHSTGHGVGLDVHERPSLGTTGGPLATNHVVTVEPGLYDPEVGGVRVEDLVVVTEDGFHNLTGYPTHLVVP